MFCSSFWDDKEITDFIPVRGVLLAKMQSAVTQEKIEVEPICTNESTEQFIENMQAPVHLERTLENNFKNSTGISSFKRDDSRRVHDCFQCRKSFTRRFNLERHVNSVHRTEEIGQTKVSGNEIGQRGTTFKSAESCDKLFSEANNNIRTKIKSLECDFCQKKFYYISELTRHIRGHTGEKPYECEKCMLKFSEKSNLDKHRRVHEGVKPYQCDICLLRLSERSGLRRHRLLHSGEKMYQCDICLKKYSGKCALVRHRLSHTGDKPYQCEICLKSFSRKSSLDEHKRIHTGEKPYQCEICLKRFCRGSFLYKHKRVHTMEVGKATEVPSL